MLRTWLRFGAAGVLALLLAAPAAATSIRPPKDLGALARMCRAVVLARAAGDRVEDRGLPFTVTSFELLERVGGARTRFAFEVEVPGGALATTAAIVSGAPRFERGRNYLLFLARGPHGRWRPQMLAWGLLEEVDSSLLVALPESAHLELLDGGEQPTVYRERELLAHLREVLAGAPWDPVRAGVEHGSVVAKLHTKPAACQFQTHSDGLPLRNFGYETGATMSIQHTTPGQSGIADGGVAAVQQGVAAWTNHPDSVLNFLYGGSRARNISCSSSSDVDDGGVVFNDPCGDIADLVGCTGTLAFGGSFYNPNATQSYDGEPWHDVTSAFVVVNNGTECVGETKFKTMLTHELGHTQGFGHHTDPNATMAAFLPPDLRGAALGTTDKACASYAYHTFLDVPYNYWSWKFIEAIENRGVTTGCGGGNYCPTAPMTRGDMAIFLLKAKEGGAYVPPPCTTAIFADVPCSSPYAPWVNELVRRGVTAGCGGGNYCPGNAVNRAEMSVFLLATLQGAGYQPPACTVPRFLDVPCSTPFAPWINEIAARGITAGCGGGNFCPTLVVGRDQMAVFITQTFALPTP